MNPTSLSFDWQPIRIAVDASNPNGGFGDLPYQELSRIDSGVVFRDINPTTTDNTSIRFYIRNIGMPFQIWLRSINTTSQVLIEIDSLYNVTEVSVNSGSYSVFNTNDNGWHEVILTLTSAVGDRVILYLDHLSIIGNSFDLCQLDLIQDINLTSPIITNGSTETRNDDIYSVTPPSGTSEIKEYLANGTINTITTIPATYTPAVGKYKKIVMS
jgi:hypothetical protein